MRTNDLDLSRIRIASPCSADWNSMVGDERSRFCGGCRKNVYDLSSMTESDARDLVAEKEGALCIRLRRRADGTVISGDCPVGWRRLRVVRRRFAAAVAGLFGLALGLVTTGCRPGGDARTEAPAVSGSAGTDAGIEPGHEIEMGDVMMGEFEAVAPPATVMGRVRIEPLPNDG